MESVSIVFPHQLFAENPCLHKNRKIFLAEESLFFRQYKFHKQKLVFHRASMKFYKNFLLENSYKVEYIDSENPLSDIRKLVPWLHEKGVKEIHVTELSDNWLEKRISKSASKVEIRISTYPSPMFLNPLSDVNDWFKDRKKFFHADFYADQRKKHAVLVDEQQNPEGGKWSFDAENRLKYPKKKTPPDIQFPAENKFVKEARQWVEKHFTENYGRLDSEFIYPVTFIETDNWLEQFLENRFYDFGKYEDAIVQDEHILHHSVLTPMLNVGLITPKQVIDKTLGFANRKKVPLNSLEGFIRQIIGWREFIRGIYEVNGSKERTRNFWGFNRKIPESFWKGTTGIEPMDATIKKVLKTGYAHHIERLMVIGNFMLLCEFDPDEVYRWFMELFIDAYDWVMVPNVYGMSQFADGGLMATKPYMSGSNYLMKMSDFSKGDWQKTWDGLFWRFMHVHRDFFLQNPRLGMLVRTFDKMKEEKQKEHLKNAEDFLERI